MTEQVALWKPHDGPQTNFLRSQAFDVGYGGSLGGGKTAALMNGGLRFVGHPGCRSLFLRRTFKELRGVMDKAILDFARIGGVWVASENRFKFPSGATYEFGYMESFADVQQYVGQEYTYIAFDQLEQMPDDRGWTTLLTRLRTTATDIVLMARSSFNPGGVGHGWIKRRYIMPCQPDGTPIIDEHGNTRAFYQATLYDNPTLMAADPGYERRLMALPPTLRDQMLYGLWDVGEGIAFPGLTAKPPYLTRRKPPVGRLGSAFDWGYGHRWSFGLYQTLPSGVVERVDGTGGRLQTPVEIVERCLDLIRSRLGPQATFADVGPTFAGWDVKQRENARGNAGPSVSEQFIQYGWVLIPADIRRIAGYTNMLMYLDASRGAPLFTFQNTTANRLAIAQLTEMSTDPDSPNDVLKVDVNPQTGEGGDDIYDEIRYFLMSRPLAIPVSVAAPALTPNHHRGFQQYLKKPYETTHPRAPRLTGARY